jgi:hypothetical protein
LKHISSLFFSSYLEIDSPELFAHGKLKPWSSWLSLPSSKYDRWDTSAQ